MVCVRSLEVLNPAKSPVTNKVSLAIASRKDVRREVQKKYRLTPKYKAMRNSKRLQKSNKSEKQKMSEGPTYGAGLFGF